MYRQLILPLLAQLDAEFAHELTLDGLGWLSHRPLLLGLARRRWLLSDPRLAVQVAGLALPNPVGVAAGLDKNGVAATALHSFGFGHVEVGTVTPTPQLGNPRPRVFRLLADDAIINRLGFPGVGATAAGHHLGRLRGARPVLGINLGANKPQVAAGAAAADYCAALQLMAPHADYFAINVSSPNTAQLRDLQGRAALDALLAEVLAARDGLARRRPVFLKIAPDLTPAALDDILAVAVERGVDGIIATNTTVERPASLRSASRVEAGGLSGAPLRARATAIIHTIHRATGGRLPVIGVGGVASAADAWEKLAAGASAVQLYTAMLYHGPLLGYHINRGLLARLHAEGLPALQALVGTAA